MEPEEARIAGQIKSTPPTCIKEFDLTPTELPEFWDDNFKTVYSLACRCGETKGAILGHLLRDYNPDCGDDDMMITPLAFRCATCDSTTEILDTNIHGYHAEIAKIDGGVGSTKYRGTGPRTKYSCPKCNNEEFSKLTVGYVFWDFDLMLDQPELPAQEFFDVFLIYVDCSTCNHVSRVTDLGKL